jgi:hypothetical protein
MPFDVTLAPDLYTNDSGYQKIDVANIVLAHESPLDPDWEERLAKIPETRRSGFGYIDVGSVSHSPSAGNAGASLTGLVTCCSSALPTSQPAYAMSFAEPGRTVIRVAYSSQRRCIPPSSSRCASSTPNKSVAKASCAATSLTSTPTYPSRKFRLSCMLHEAGGFRFV